MKNKGNYNISYLSDNRATVYCAELNIEAQESGGTRNELAENINKTVRGFEEILEAKND